MRESNILDPVQDRLDPRIFNYKTPKPSVVQFVKRLYYRAFSQKFHVPPDQVSDFIKLVLTGSLTTYQYSDTSDMDVSVFPNWTRFQSLGLDEHDVRQMLVEMNIDHLDGSMLPGSPHPLQFFTVTPGVTPDVQFKPGLRSGYDLDAMDWIVPPEEARSKTVQIQYPDVFERASEIADKMKMMLDNGDAPRAIELWKQVHKKRQEEQRAGGGDYSEGNIVYKWLVHEGLVDRLRQELGLQIATHVKRAVEWEDDELDPRIIDNRDGGMEVWQRLERQVEQLAQTFEVQINWLARNQVERSNYSINYQTTDGEYPKSDNSNVDFQVIAKFPHITGELSYFAALHEIGHAAFHRIYHDPFVSNSQEEELWAWHFALENSQVSFDQKTLEWAKKMFDTYDSPNTGVESDIYPGWLNTYDHRQINQERSQGDLPAVSPNYPLYSAVDYNDGLGIRGPSSTPAVFNMPPQVEQNFVSRMECPYCHHHLRNIDGQIYCEYCGWQPRTASLIHIMYDFEKDRITLGSKDSDVHSKMIGNYDPSDNAATLFEAEKQWINPTYFRRLWNYSFPNYPLKSVMFQAGDTTHTLKTREHPYHERHLD